MLKNLIDRLINRIRGRNKLPDEPPMKCGYWMFRDSIKPGGHFTTDTEKTIKLSHYETTQPGQ